MQGFLINVYGRYMQTDKFSVFGFFYFDLLISVIFVVFDSGLVIKIRKKLETKFLINRVARTSRPCLGTFC